MVVFKLTAPLPGKLIPVLLVLGALALGVGCYAGFAANADRVVVFVLFGISVALFLAALSLPWVWRAHSPASSALKALVPVVPTSLVVKPSAASLPPSLSTATVIAAVVQAGPSPSPSPSPSPKLAVPMAPQVTPDVATLMQAPLADLLLAALCKDADGARRIFKQALHQAGPTE